MGIQNNFGLCFNSNNSLLESCTLRSSFRWCDNDEQEACSLGKAPPFDILTLFQNNFLYFLFLFFSVLKPINYKTIFQIKKIKQKFFLKKLKIKIYYFNEKCDSWLTQNISTDRNEISNRKWLKSIKIISKKKNRFLIFFFNIFKLCSSIRVHQIPFFGKCFKKKYWIFSQISFFLFESTILLVKKGK